MKKKMKSTSIVGVLLVILVSLEVMCCEGCLKEERDALLALNHRRLGNSRSLIDSGYPLVNTMSRFDGTDCCEWYGVECNTTTGRVVTLDLSSTTYGPWHLNYSDFKVFTDLKRLDLSHNQISDCAERMLENLEYLSLAYNDFQNGTSILSCLDGLSSLKTLILSGNGLDHWTSVHAFETLSSKLLRLEVLDISDNSDLTNHILPSLRGFTSLKTLDISGIGLDSDHHIQGLCAALKHLEILLMSANNFTHVDIGSPLSGLLSLKSLYLSDSTITPRSLHNISKLRSLEILDLSANDLNESFLGLLENNGFAWPTNLQVLGLRFNGFSGNILSHLSGLPHLKSLDLSYNQLISGSITDGFAWPTNLQVLGLSHNYFSDNILSHLSGLSRLKSLDLSHNELNGSISTDFRHLSNLERLVLDNNANLGNEFLRNIGELTSLKVLSLQSCEINGTLRANDWSKLTKLVELDLSDNKFVGPLPSSFVNMTSLETLKLDTNNFTGDIGSTVTSLTSLEYLSFEDNLFDFPISFTPFVNHSNLKFIYGNGNKVILDSHSSSQTWIPKFQLQVLELSSVTDFKFLPLPNFLHYQYSLTHLDFTGCKLGGKFPNWLLENNTNVIEFDVESCCFTGEFKLPSHPIVNLERIDVSNNTIKGELRMNNISSIFPSLGNLFISGNEIHGSIPYELSHMNSLFGLDLSDNQLSGEIPSDIFGASQQLRFLKLSNNKLNGSMPHIWFNSELGYLFLDGNFLSGRIPSGFYNSSNIISVDLSTNDLTGEISSHIKNLSAIQELYMSNNHFQGPIPSELSQLEDLDKLDLSQNKLIGCVPSFENSTISFIQLGNNNLSCFSKRRMFKENTSLVMLDISYNKITNGIQDLIHDLSSTSLNILLMKGNQFSGNIPKQLCQIDGLRILDLSHNNFSGEIPNCLAEFSFEIVSDLDFSDQHDHMISISWDGYMREKATFTSKKRSETYSGSIFLRMSGIDLSCNKLNGNIPRELGNLTSIRALNLSHNYLTGKIPATFSNLVQVESLDLSFNKLSGQIPPQLSGLTSLEVFSVAHNNLSGATPEWKGQFATFDESSYEGNQFLCGPPLPESCNPNGQANVTILPNDSNMDEEYSDDWVDMYFFYVSFAVAYTSILLVIAAVLYINPYWRQAWFYYIELVVMNCYYFIEDNLCKFF